VRPSADRRIDRGSISRETRKERVEKATRRSAGLLQYRLKFPATEVIHHRAISKPRLTQTHCGTAGFNLRQEMSKR